MSVADFAQSGSLSINGFCAASDSASTVDFFFSHSSEFEDTATTRLPSFEATANITVFGFGFNDSSSALTHLSGLPLALKLSRYTKRTVTPVSFFVWLMASVISETFEPSRFCVSVMSSVAVMPNPALSSAWTGGVIHSIKHKPSTPASNMQIAIFQPFAVLPPFRDTPTEPKCICSPTTAPFFSLHTLTDDIASTVPSGCANRDRMEKHTNHH